MSEHNGPVQPAGDEGLRALRLTKALSAWLLAQHRRDAEGAAHLLDAIVVERPTTAELLNTIGWAAARLPQPWDPADGGPLSVMLTGVYSAVPENPLFDPDPPC